MQNKLKVLSAVLLGACVVGMASCDTIEVSLKKDDAEAVLVNAGEDSLKGNTVGELYDEIVKAGSSNSEKVLNNLLYKLAQAYFGEFYGDNGLYKTMTTGTAEQKQAYANAHKEMFDGSVKKLENFYAKIKESLDKSFYAIVKNTTYQQRGVFFEKDFVQAQEKELYSFGDVNEFKEGLVVGYKTYENVQEYFQDDYIAFYEDYIENVLIKDAYRKALVEMHLISQNYNTLGRSYARKVQYIALGNVEGFPDATERLVKAYGKLVLSGTDADLKLVHADLDIDQVRNLHFLNRLQQGHFNADEEANIALANAIYAEAGFNELRYTDEQGNSQIAAGVYEQTSYGLLLKDYYKLTSSRWEEGSTTDFTGGSAYTKETGLKIKTNEILASSKVTEGWYTSSGLSDLPSDIKSRLFKVNVANDLDNEGKAPDFGIMLNGSYYLTQKKYSRDDNEPECMLDSSSSTWYIVRVDEAVKGPKLQKGGASAYDDDKLEKIVLDVANLIADGDAYKKAARQYYVKKAAVEYHDQAVYDYFKETFPDLFD